MSTAESGTENGQRIESLRQAATKKAATKKAVTQKVRVLVVALTLTASCGSSASDAQEPFDASAWDCAELTPELRCGAWVHGSAAAGSLVFPEEVPTPTLVLKPDKLNDFTDEHLAALLRDLASNEFLLFDDDDYRRQLIARGKDLGFNPTDQFVHRPSANAADAAKVPNGGTCRTVRFIKFRVPICG